MVSAYHHPLTTTTLQESVTMADVILSESKGAGRLLTDHDKAVFMDCFRQLLPAEQRMIIDAFNAAKTQGGSE